MMSTYSIITTDNEIIVLSQIETLFLCDIWRVTFKRINSHLSRGSKSPNEKNMKHEYKNIVGHNQISFIIVIA